ncbi:MAG: SDR family NAD(P)-dependent oxidoreductase [Myxococcota bacterium]|nr:SDR family NAD(P)-dependent oxidoreductase [Myxococcota bacterium]
MRLEGKVAAVTGGSRSIGRGIVEAFLKEGAQVAFNGRDAQTGAQTLAELDQPERTLFVAGDARNSGDIRALVEATVEKFGRIDIMVNNAGGITEPAPIATLSDEAWGNDIQWNLSSVFYGTKHAVAHMVPQKFGRIINISSVEGKLGKPGMAGYVAAKHGVNGLTKSAAAEVGRDGVTVNAICPGLILTDAVTQGGPETAAAMGMTYDEMVNDLFRKETKTGELNTVEQVAELSVLLASDLGAGFTGSLISLDAGISPY